MNKKWIVAAVIMVLIVAVAAFVVGKGSAKSEEEKAVDALFPKIQSVAAAPEIKTINAEGLQLAAQINKEHFERIGSLSLVVKVKNTGTQTLQKATLVRTLFGPDGAVIGMKNTLTADVSQLKPGDVFTKDLDMLSANAKTIGKVELSFKEGSVTWLTASASTPIPASKTTTSPAPTATPPKPTASTTSGTTYTAQNYPKNPVTPAEVAIAYICLTAEKKYDLVIALASTKLQKEAPPREEWEAAVSKGPQLKGIKVDEETIRESKAYIRVTIYYLGGYSRELKLDLVEEEGKWKIE